MWARRTKTLKSDALHNFFVILTSSFSKHVVCYHLCETNGSTAAIKIQTITVYSGFMRHIRRIRKNNPSWEGNVT
jgi:hypothetical protein